MGGESTKYALAALAVKRGLAGTGKPADLHGYRAPVRRGDHRRLIKNVLTHRFFANPDTYAGFTYGEDRIDALERMARACRSQGVKLMAFIGPVHALQLETMRLMGLGDTYARFRRDVAKTIAKVNGEDIDGPTIDAWDFGGYEGPTLERVPRADEPKIAMSWFLESSHFHPRLGEVMLARMLDRPMPDGAPSDFGAPLTPETIDARIAASDRERERWAREHPDEIRWLEQLYRKTASQRARRLAAGAGG